MLFTQRCLYLRMTESYLWLNPELESAYEEEGDGRGHVGEDGVVRLRGQRQDEAGHQQSDHGHVLHKEMNTFGINFAQKNILYHDPYLVRREAEHVPLAETGVDAHEGEAQVDAPQLQDQPHQCGGRGRSQLGNGTHFIFPIFF